MHAINNRLSPAQYLQLLQESASAFPTSSPTADSTCRVPAAVNDVQDRECICTTQTCGAGMLNTHAAVLAAQRPFAIAAAPTTIEPGTSITIDGRTSFASNGSQHQRRISGVCRMSPGRRLRSVMHHSP